MNTFNPDLIVEVTSACNRSCKGCYAPNVVSNKSAAELKEKDPSLFLGIVELQQALISINDVPSTISFRGGEPSIHPDLPSILNLTRFFGQILVIETHGRWLLEKERESYQLLIDTIINCSVVLKISFDSMHKTSTNELFEIVSYLEATGIQYLVAITESSEDEFNNTRNSILLIPSEKIIFQQKAISSEELIKPRIGVINSRGVIRNQLTSKFITPVESLLMTTGNAV